VFQVPNFAAVDQAVWAHVGITKNGNAVAAKTTRLVWERGDA